MNIKHLLLSTFMAIFIYSTSLTAYQDPLSEIVSNEEFQSLYPHLDNYPILPNEQVARFFLVRHGENVANQNELIDGRTLNLPLTEKGITEALSTGQILAQKLPHIDLLVSSPLIRTLQTAEGILASFSQRPEILLDERLLERYHGIFEGHSTSEFKTFHQADEEASVFPTFLEKMQYREHPSVENYAETYERMAAAILELAKTHLGKNIVFTTHGNSIRSIFHMGNAIQHNVYIRNSSFKPVNGCILVIESDGNHIGIKALQNLNYVEKKLMIPTSSSITDIYAWRHGETDSNHKHLLTGGGADTEIAHLNEKGLAQAKELSKKIKKLCPDLSKIYSSDLQRTMKTAETVSEVFEEKIKIHPTPQLREIYHGKYELSSADERNKQAIALIDQELKNEILDRYHFWKIHPLTKKRVGAEVLVRDIAQEAQEGSEDPETVFELYLRVHSEFLRIAKENLGQKIGISLHGGVLATLVDSLTCDPGLLLPPFYFNKPTLKDEKVIIPAAAQISNGALFHFQYEESTNSLKYCGNL